MTDKPLVNIVSLGDHTIRCETEIIDVTRGPTVNHPGDMVRQTAPGMIRYYIDDVEVTENELAAFVNEYANSEERS